jgi:hypothetical protein
MSAEGIRWPSHRVAVVARRAEARPRRPPAGRPSGEIGSVHPARGCSETGTLSTGNEFVGRSLSVSCVCVCVCVCVGRRLRSGPPGWPRRWPFMVTRAPAPSSHGASQVAGKGTGFGRSGWWSRDACPFFTLAAAWKRARLARATNSCGDPCPFRECVCAGPPPLRPARVAPAMAIYGDDGAGAVLAWSVASRETDWVPAEWMVVGGCVSVLHAGGCLETGTLSTGNEFAWRTLSVSC